MSLSLFLFSFVLAFNSQDTKQGDIPFIVINPDTLVTETTSTQFAEISSDIEDIIGLEGGNFSVGLIDLATGESVSRSESGSVNLDDPNIFLLAYAVDEEGRAPLALDTLRGRNETLEDQFLSGFRGNTEAALRAMNFLGLENTQIWAENSGFINTDLSSVQLEWEGAPEENPSKSTADDVLEILQILYSNIGDPSVRRIMRNPSVDSEFYEALGTGTILYGLVDTGSDHKTYAIIAITAEGRELGLVVLADDLCCEGKGDLAFRMLCEAASELL